MKDRFPGFYFHGDEVRTDVLREGLVVLDANALLHLHRYPVGVRDQLLSVFEACSERLWIPYQAALEYNRNRLSVLSEQQDRFRSVRDVLTKVKGELRSKLDELQLRRRHALIDPDPLIGTVNGAIDDFLRDLTRLEQTQSEQESELSLQERLSALVSERLGTEPTQQWLDSVYEEGAVRYQRLMPPGYLDQPKSKRPGDGVYCYAGRVFQDQFGDLVLWKEVLEKARNDGHTSVVLVTDDSKDDWWLKRGKRLLAPRPELVDEAKREGQIERFVMLTSERFATLAAEALGVGFSEDAVQSIEAVRSAADADQPGFEEPGFIEKLADAEEGMEGLVGVAEMIVAELNHIGQIFVGGTARMKASGDFRLRRRVINQSAEELESVTPRFTEGVERFESLMTKIAPGMGVVIEQIRKLEMDGQDVGDTRSALVNMAQMLVDSKSSALEFEQVLVDLPDATAPFSHAVRALKGAVGKYASICSIAKGWLEGLEGEASS